MPKLLLLLISFSLSPFANAQSPNFFVDGSRWVYQTSESYEPNQPTVSGQTEQNMIQGDTIIGGVLYGKLYTIYHFGTTIFLPWPQPPISTTSQGQAGPTFIRYDTFENKVYYLPSVDSTERVIYDFNLVVGDSMPMQSSFYLSRIVDSLENVSFFGTSVKKFYTTAKDGLSVYEANYIIEGMGGSNGLTYFQPEHLLVSGGFFSTNLVCFQSGDSIYSPTNSDCPFLEFVSTNNSDSEKHTVLVAPNPTQGAYSVLVSEELRDANFVVTDCLGRKIQSYVLTEQTISGQLPASGIYFWQIEKEGHLLKTGKLICE